MRKVLLIALFGGVVVATPSFAEEQDVVALQAAPVPAAPARPATAPAAPRPPAAPATAAPAPPAPAPAPQAPPPPGSVPVRPNAPNIRFDVTITDTGGAKPVTKTLSLTIGSYNNSGSIRQTSQAPNPSGVPPQPPTLTVPLNVDVRNVNWQDNNGVRATVAVEYQPYLPDAKIQPGMILANATTVFFDGRRTQILVTSDPVSDRKTTIEVTATILK